MGSLRSCFGSRKGKKLISHEGTAGISDKRRPRGKTVSSSIGGNVKRSEIKTESKQEKLFQKDGVGTHGKAQTFTYQELVDATKNFSPETLIGEGGFGSVYKGQIHAYGQVVAAVKKLNPTGLQGDKEFLVEVLMLSLLHHPNLVSMIGYCAEGEQRLLVYEYMPLGSLEDHLHDITPDKEPLDWNTRMIIAAGAAKGLEYLHSEANPPVIYRDFKASNILLGEGFHPKLSDFGLAKFGPSGGVSHVSTRVMGTHGYCAPEYALTGKLTMKSDVYSFGVVLFELITGRRALDPSRGHGKQNLVEWIRPLLRDRKNYLQLADPHLKGRFSEPMLCRAIEVASMCVREVATTRPSMSDAVLALNFLLSHPYNPSAEPGHCAERSNLRDERGGGEEDSNGNYMGKKGCQRAAKEDRRGHHEGNRDSNACAKEETTRMLNKDLDRERAVADAKMWGESWREKRRRQGTETSDDPKG